MQPSDMALGKDTVECFIHLTISTLSEGEQDEPWSKKKTKITNGMKSETGQTIHILSWL